MTCSNRLAKQLGVSSVVLKQRSPHIEWFYRSLVAGHHYVSFWDHGPEDLMQVLRGGGLRTMGQRT